MRAMRVRCGVRDVCGWRDVARRFVVGDRDSIAFTLPERARAGLFVAVNRALGRAVDRARARVVVMGTVSSAVSMSRTRWVMDD